MLQVSKKTLNIRGRLWDLQEPLVMGVLNVTDDSFFAGSRVTSVQEMVDRAGTMAAEGASIIDIGGYSTRPGARDIQEHEETDRAALALSALSKNFPDLIFSIDTFRSKVAETAVQHGAHIINDVAGGTLDPDMFGTVARLKVPYILMHMRGTPAIMSQMTRYEVLVRDILKDLSQKVRALRALNVADIIVDPGFGFAKTIPQNFEILNHLDEFSVLNCPVLVGLSRKKTIYHTLDTTPENALNGTTVLNTLALEKGASILRVHDVKAATEAVKLWMATSAV